MADDGPPRHAGPPLDDAAFAGEAATFVRVMGDLAPALALDFTPASLEPLEAVLAASFDRPGAEPAPPSLAIGVGCYVGEVVRRTLGGRWNEEGHLEAVGPVVEVFPLRQARQRLEHGSSRSLVAWYAAVAEAAAGRPPG